MALVFLGTGITSLTGQSSYIVASYMRQVYDYIDWPLVWTKHMRFEMSSASLPDPFGGALPQRAPSRPEPSGPKIVKPVPPRPRSRALWLGLAAAAIVAGAGLYLNRDRLAPPEGGGGPGGTVVRTAVIAARGLHRT